MPSTDDLGRRVPLAAPARRVVSLAPNITEILFAVGAGPQVVGVTDHCDHPAAATLLPRVGGFINPSLERVVALAPDLVLATADGNRAADVERLASMGTPVFVIDPRRIDDVLRSIATIGRLTGHGEEATRLVDSLAGRRRAVAARRRDPAPSVLLLVGIHPLVGVGPGTFLDDLLREAGGRNALASSPVRYPLLSAESLLAAAPDVIVVDAVEAGDAGDLARSVPGWSDLAAVRAGSVHLLRDDTLLRPGPRIGDGLELLAELLARPAGRRR
jgi:iron complex transport system substrate-binding protein